MSERAKKRVFGTLAAAIGFAIGLTTVGAQGAGRAHGPHFVGYFALGTCCNWETYALTAGPDGTFWYTYSGNAPPSAIGSFRAQGRTVKDVRLHDIVGNPVSFATNIAAAPDGNLWALAFVGLEQVLLRIDRLDRIVYYPIPGTNIPDVGGITVGSDGNIWFVDDAAHTIGRIAPSGPPIEFFPVAGQPLFICAGPDGNVWFSTDAPSSVGKISPSGAVQQYPAPGGSSSGLGAIVPGPDGNVWVTEGLASGAYVAKVTPNGQTTSYAVPAPITAMVWAADGNLWGTQNSTGQLVRMTPGGTTTEYTLPWTPAGIPFPYGIARAAGNDRAIWWVDNNFYAGLFALQ